MQHKTVTQYVAHVGHEIKGHRFAEGDVVAEVHGPIGVAPHYLIEQLRSNPLLVTREASAPVAAPATGAKPKGGLSRV